MAFSWNNDNGTAASNARGGLEGLANFLYQQQVLKPQVQAQTQEALARTGLLKGELTAQDIANINAHYAQIAANPNAIDYDAAANAAVSGPGLGSKGAAQPTDVPPTTPPAVGNPNNAANGAPAGTIPSGYSGGSALTTPSPTPNIPRRAGDSSGQSVTSAGANASGPFTLPPGTDHQGSGAESGVSDIVPSPAPDDKSAAIVAGRVKLNQARAAVGLPPLPAQTLPDVTAGTGNAVTTPGQSAGLAGTGSVMGVTPAASRNTPPIVQPNIGQPPGAAPKLTGDDLRNMQIWEMPPAAQQHILQQLRAPYTKAGLPISDEALAGIFTQNKMRSLPPAFLRQGAVLDTFGPEGIKGHFPQPGQGLPPVDLSGDVSHLPVQVPGLHGEPVNNPAYLPPEKIKDARDDLATINQARQILDNTRGILTSNPELIGPGNLSMLTGGGKIANARRSLGAKVSAGGEAELAKQKQLQQYEVGQILDMLQTLHLGRVTELEYKQLVGKNPSQSDPIENWHQNLARVEQLLQTKYENIANQVRGQGLEVQPYSPTPVGAPKLPGVNLPPSGIQAPATPRSYKSWEEAAQLPAGTHFIGPDGQHYTHK